MYVLDPSNSSGTEQIKFQGMTIAKYSLACKAG